MTDNLIGIERVTRSFLRKNMVNIHLVSMAVYEGKLKDGPSHSLVFVGATADDARNNAIEYLRSVHDEKRSTSASGRRKRTRPGCRPAASERSSRIGPLLPPLALPCPL